MFISSFEFDKTSIFELSIATRFLKAISFGAIPFENKVLLSLVTTTLVSEDLFTLLSLTPENEFSKFGSIFEFSFTFSSSSSSLFLLLFQVLHLHYFLLEQYFCFFF